MAEQTAQQEQQPASTPAEAVRHGSRWLHRHPTEDQVREWFRGQTLHQGMEHDPYIGGIVVIGSTDKPKITKLKSNGEPFVVEVEVAVFTPYVKVDTRIAYFWDLVRAMNEQADADKFVGVIEHVRVPRITNPTSPYYNEHLPDGFGSLMLRNGDSDSYNRYMTCTVETAIYERESYARRLNGSNDRPVLAGRGTKQVPTSKRFADDNTMMKAETGAIGRALGVAGVLVVGTGVATAEDMQEASANEAAPAVAAPAGPAVPTVVAHGPAEAPQEAAAPAQTAGAAVPEQKTEAMQDDELRAKAMQLQAVMSKEHPEAWAAYREWWAGREFGPISELGGPALRGAVIKLERDLEEAKSAAAGAPAPEAPEPVGHGDSEESPEAAPAEAPSE